MSDPDGKQRGMDLTIFEKATAELPILRNFMDFVNHQVGVYCDSLSSLNGNKVRIERQIPRVQRPAGRRIEQGHPVIVWVSVEDPTSPDVIHHRTIRADEYVAANSEAGFNEQQVCWSIIVFVFAYWDEEIRPQIARVRGVKPNDVMIDELGDLRILRKSIVHDGGNLSAAEHAKLNVMSGLCRPRAAAFRDEQFCSNFQNVEEHAAYSRHDWLAHYMLREGTWNTSIVLLDSTTVADAAHSARLKTPLHLLEGHRRLAFLQGLKRLGKARPEHVIWLARHDA
jgi:hypothetical protein